MSAIVLEFRRTADLVQRRAAERMLDRLEHRGPDGRRLLTRDRVAVGCRQFWTTPEEIGERQPVADVDRLLTFDGRLDNRSDLLRALDRLDSESRRMSDAMLVLEAYRTWGSECFDRLLGPFAVVLWDAPARTVLAARDGLGDRTLFFSLDRRRLLIASEEHALLAHPEISSRLDEHRIAHHFAITVPADGSTFFADVSELQPGEVLVVSETEHRIRRCWRPQPEPEIARLSDNDCVDRYRELLTEAVRCRLRSSTPPAAIMSGGLDSTSVAAIGARVLEASRRNSSMRAVSWVFEELQECDERSFMDAVIARYGLEAWRVPGDDAWPLKNPDVLSRNPSTPEQNPYRELKQRAFRRAAAGGSRTVLSGATADLFSSGTERWMWDLLRAGRVLEAGSSLVADVRKRGLFEAMRRAGFGAPFRRIRARLSSPPRRTPWLTNHARGRLGPDITEEWWHGVFPRPAQCSVVLGAREARGATLENFDGCRAGVEVRFPYRDRRLTEFMLQVPAHQLYRNGRHKHLARVVGAGLLPPEIPARVEPTVLTPLFRRGVFERERATVERLLGAKDAVWPRFVEPRLVAEILRFGPRRPLDEILLWHCVGFESWIRRHGWLDTTRHGSEGCVSLQESEA
jgi:asparagine synthase (glutamine-hydrolysing)